MSTYLHASIPYIYTHNRGVSYSHLLSLITPTLSPIITPFYDFRLGRCVCTDVCLAPPQPPLIFSAPPLFVRIRQTHRPRRKTLLPNPPPFPTPRRHPQLLAHPPRRNGPPHLQHRAPNRPVPMSRVLFARLPTYSLALRPSLLHSLPYCHAV